MSARGRTVHGGRTKVCVPHKTQLGDGPPTQSVAGAALPICIIHLRFSPRGKGDVPRIASTQAKCQVGKGRGNAAVESKEGLWHLWKRDLTTTQPCGVTPKGLWGPPSQPCSCCSHQHLLCCCSKDSAQLGESSTWTEHSRGEK